MRTLAEMNAAGRSHRWPFGRPATEQYIMSDEYAVGRVGRARTGEKLHLLMVTRVLTVPAIGHNPRRHSNVGDVHSSHSPCNGNGQHVGQVVKGLDTDDITCKKCSF